MATKTFIYTISLLAALSLTLAPLALAGGAEHRPGKAALNDSPTIEKPSMGGTPEVPQHRPGERSLNDPRRPAGPAVQSLGAGEHRAGKAPAGYPYARNKRSRGRGGWHTAAAGKGGRKMRAERDYPAHRPGRPARVDGRFSKGPTRGGKAMVPKHRAGGFTVNDPKLVSSPADDFMNLEQHRPGSAAAGSPAGK